MRANGVKVAKGLEMVGQRACPVTSPGLKGGDELGLIAPSTT